VRAKIVTAALVAAAAMVALSGVRVDREARQARALLGPRASPVSVAGGPAYRGDGRTALFFSTRGAQGPIEGAIVVGDDQIQQIIVTSSQEGLTRDALRPDALAARFGGLPARGPVTVEAITGATISTQAVTDVVNDRLAAWQESPAHE